MTVIAWEGVGTTCGKEKLGEKVERCFSDKLRKSYSHLEVGSMKSWGVVKRERILN